MTAKQRNKSGRLDILLWGVQECDRQMAELKQEQKARFSEFGKIKECPCGCGLKNDICDDQLARVKAASDDIPF